jgi:hypothetical protein
MSDSILENRMRTIREKSSTLQLLIGIALAEAGAALVGCGEWDVLKTGTPWVFYATGFLVCAAGMFLIWKEPLGAMIVEGEAAQNETTDKRKSLGRIELDGRCFEACEEESDDGSKRFRLRSFPPVSPSREAAFIRYLIHEGFIEKRWPRLTGKICEEAGWAFLF